MWVAFWGMLWVATAAMAAPNIIVILSDDMGYSDLGAYGGEIRTPALDGLAERGWQFTQAYNASRCCPTRASLLTGLYPHQTGVGGMLFPTDHPGYSEHFAPDAIQLAEILQGQGYGTYMAGKWHLAPRTYNRQTDVDYWPTRRGFDAFYGTIAGYGSFWDPATLYRNETALSAHADPDYRPETYYYTDAITDNALRFLRAHQRERPQDPFFLYLSYTAAHWPLHAFAEDIAAYEGVYEEGYAAIREGRLQRLRALGLIPEVGSVAPLEHDGKAINDAGREAALMATYAAMISRMDSGIGKVLAFLEESGAFNDTLVFYLQDNGSNAEDWFSGETAYRDGSPPMSAEALQTATLPPMWTREGRPVRTGMEVWPGPDDTYLALRAGWANVSNTPFRKFKHYAHEGGISTPLILSWPALGSPARESRLVREPVHVIDIVPTCLEAAGAPHPAHRNGVPIQKPEGISLLPLLMPERPFARPNGLFWEHEGSRAVRDGDWKLVATGGGPWELYDMRVDRGETRDLALVYPHITDRLTVEWHAWAERSRVLPLGGWFDRKGERTLFLRAGEHLSPPLAPRLANQNITLQATVLEGPCEGVILSQGDPQNGFMVSLHGDRASLSVLRDGQLDRLDLEGLPSPPFNVIASVRKNGRILIGVDDRRLYGDLPEGIRVAPKEGLRIGQDAAHHPASAPPDMAFEGRLGSVLVRGKIQNP